MSVFGKIVFMKTSCGPDLPLAIVCQPLLQKKEVDGYFFNLKEYVGVYMCICVIIPKATLCLMIIHRSITILFNIALDGLINVIRQKSKVE